MTFIHFVAVALGVTTLVAFLFANRFIGSPEWKEEAGEMFAPLGNRVTAYCMTTIFTLLFALSTMGYRPLSVLVATVLLSLTYVAGRQRSPRGTFFLASGGRTQYWQGDKLKFYDGEHNRISEWLAEKTSGVKFPTALYQDKSADVLRYSWHHGLWHVTWLFAIASIPLSLFVFAYAWALVPIGMLHGVSYAASGVLWMRKREEGAKALAERYEGLFCYGLFTVLCVLGGAYCEPGILSNIFD